MTLVREDRGQGGFNFFIKIHNSQVFGNGVVGEHEGYTEELHMQGHHIRRLCQGPRPRVALMGRWVGAPGRVPARSLTRGVPGSEGTSANQSAMTEHLQLP